MKNLQSILNKKGRAGTMALGTIGVIALIAILGLIVWQVFGTGVRQQQIGGREVPIVAGQCSSLCPSDTDWTGTVNLQNSLNKTGSETFDSTMYFFDPAGTLVTSITDTTAGAITLTCGSSYKVKVISTSGNSGDSSFLKSATVSDGTTSSDGNGNIDLTVCGAQGTFDVQGYQHGLWEIRARDVLNDAYLLNGTATVTQAITYVPGNQVFGSTTNNATSANTTIGAGGQFHVKLFARPTIDDNNLNDRGVYVLLDMDTNDWNAPTLRIDGTVTSDIKSELSSDEKRAYTAYEYVYRIPSSLEIRNVDEVEIEVDTFALAGVNPAVADSPVFAFAPIGQYTSTVTVNSLKVGSAQDDSAATAVHTLQTATFGVA